MPTKKKPNPSRSIVVTVDDERMPKIAEVAEQLRSRGVQVDSVMEATGIITGSTDAHSADLRSIPGVMSVEDQPHFQLPPPDSSVQ